MRARSRAFAMLPCIAIIMRCAAMYSDVVADTNIGVDDRNQFQLIESQPGGVEGLRRVVDELHARQVRVLWPYNPWDQGTRGGSLNATKAGIDDASRLSAMLKQTNGDGFCAAPASKHSSAHSQLHS